MAPEAALAGFYDYRLVALSVLLAMVASYAALDLAGRITSARGPVRSIWLTGGAAAMGLGIWSMHYVGMLAYSLPVVVLYDWPTVLVSLLSAVLASAIALWVVSQKEMGPLRTIVGGVLMGIGIAAMHYIGMEARRLPAMCRYSVAIVSLSVVLAEYKTEFRVMWPEGAVLLDINVPEIVQKPAILGVSSTSSADLEPPPRFLRIGI